MAVGAAACAHARRTPLAERAGISAEAPDWLTDTPGSTHTSARGGTRQEDTRSRITRSLWALSPRQRSPPRAQVRGNFGPFPVRSVRICAFTHSGESPWGEWECELPESADLDWLDGGSLKSWALGLQRCSRCSSTAETRSASPSSLWSGRTEAITAAAPGRSPSGPRRCASRTPCTRPLPPECSAPASRGATGGLCSRTWCCRSPAHTHRAPAGCRCTRCRSPRRASSARSTGTRSASTRGCCGAGTWDTASKVRREEEGWRDPRTYSRGFCRVLNASRLFWGHTRSLHTPWVLSLTWARALS